MGKQLFREKSMDKISSPEQLNDYIKVSSPSIWLVMISIIVLLIGACVWGVFGHLDTKLNVACQVKDGQVICYLKDADYQSVKSGMKVELQNREYEVTSIQTVPIKVKDSSDSYLIYASELKDDEWVYPIILKGSEIKDGVYNAEIILDRVSPMSFVLN